MAYTLFEKTEIASYTDVSALLCMVRREDDASVFWKFGLYGNLCWECETETLYHCGKYDHCSYMEFENEDRILLKKIQRDVSVILLKEQLDNGYYLLLPINTRTLGCTETPYKHNVFVTGYEEDAFIVYDYWTPSFTWKYERVACGNLVQSIDFTNCETVQMVYVFKFNEKYQADNKPEHDWEKLRNTYIQFANSHNPNYDTQKNVYSTRAYYAMSECLKSKDRLFLVDCQNMHIILDHLEFTVNSLRKLFGNEETIADYCNKLDGLAKRAKKMRTVAYKSYVSGRGISKIKDYFLDELAVIKENEQSMIDYIINAKKEI